MLFSRYYFSSSTKLEIHAVKNCEKLNNYTIRLPSEDNKFWASAASLQERVPFIVYADLECTLEKLLAILYDKKCYVSHYNKQSTAMYLSRSPHYKDPLHIIIRTIFVASTSNSIQILETLAKNEFKKNLLKLMNNTVFGKTMENMRNHI